MTRIRYADNPQARTLDVNTIFTWDRGAVEPVSGGSGLKDSGKQVISMTPAEASAASATVGQGETDSQADSNGV